jgi:hypothetical protein
MERLKKNLIKIETETSDKEVSLRQTILNMGETNKKLKEEYQIINEEKSKFINQIETLRTNLNESNKENLKLKEIETEGIKEVSLERSKNTNMMKQYSDLEFQYNKVNELNKVYKEKIDVLVKDGSDVDVKNQSLIDDKKRLEKEIKELTENFDEEKLKLKNR